MQQNVSSNDLSGLLPLLVRLDQRLTKSIAIIQAEDSIANKTPYEGLIQPDDQIVAKRLSQKPGMPRFFEQFTISDSDSDSSLVLREDAPIVWLQKTLDLSLFDLELIAIALAPELDRRYEQTYAYLQDNVRHRRPTVDLALNLLCESPAEKLAHRQRFSSLNPLIDQQLLHLRSPLYQPNSTLLGQELHLENQLIQMLLGQPGLDCRLAFCCKWVSAEVELEPVGVQEDLLRGLRNLVLSSAETTAPLRLHLRGEDAIAHRQVANKLATEAKKSLLVVNLAKLSSDSNLATETLPLIFREAWFRHGWLYFDGLDSITSQDKSDVYQQLLSKLSKHSDLVFLSGKQPWQSQTHLPLETDLPISVVSIHFSQPDFLQRQQCWKTCLTSAEIALSAEDIQPLADRFRLRPSQIEAAVEIAQQTARWQTAITGKASKTTAADLFQAARSQAGQDLKKLARKVELVYRWADLVLPDELMAQLKELCQEAGNRHLVWDQWGFDCKLSLGKGLAALFSGPPGTGKTMAAEVIASELQQDLYKIDLSQIVSKYIGETEKNLNTVFAAAASSNAILLFDEADALFGKRSEVKDSRDRYANIETSYLLQKMEEYEGVAILTTNLRSNMDEAFVRRLRFILDFPLPQAAERQQIWESIWPAQVPLSPDFDATALAKQFELSGAVIRNVAVRAAFLAANDGGVVAMRHILKAVRREYQKIGKLLTADQLEI